MRGISGIHPAAWARPRASAVSSHCSIRGPCGPTRYRGGPQLVSPILVVPDGRIRALCGIGFLATSIPQLQRFFNHVGIIRGIAHWDLWVHTGTYVVFHSRGQINAYAHTHLITKRMFTFVFLNTHLNTLKRGVQLKSSWVFSHKHLCLFLKRSNCISGITRLKQCPHLLTCMFYFH